MGIKGKSNAPTLHDRHFNEEEDRENEDNKEDQDISVDGYNANAVQCVEIDEDVSQALQKRLRYNNDSDSNNESDYDNSDDKDGHDVLQQRKMTRRITRIRTIAKT